MDIWTDYSYAAQSHYLGFSPSNATISIPEEQNILVLDGNSLTPEDLLKCSEGKYKIRLSEESKRKVMESRKVLEDIVESGEIIYGVTTGFGKFANVPIPKEHQEQLQINLIRSHSAGVGPPLPPHQTRMLLALRINVLAKGYSGISLTVLQQLIDAFNAFCVSWVPEQGTVGCCGDLCPLAHLALGLMGEGKMWSRETSWKPAKEVLALHNLRPIRLQAKEGICLINGTQMIASLGVEACLKSRATAIQADIVAALTLEVAKGNKKAFLPELHQLRPHHGQIEVARRIRSLLPCQLHNPSSLAQANKPLRPVQDPYVLRCIPQVHGIVHDTIDFVYKILATEINSATDNPIVFGDKKKVISCGNFHGEYPSKALDYLAIAIHELAQMSERRLERLVNPALSNGLPAFLIEDGGLNSGFMMVQVTAASLVSENKVLCHPASADNITTSASQEDHVAMGGFAARKALQVVKNVQKVIAMELLAACQAMEFFLPLTTTEPLQKVYELVRTVSEPLTQDRTMATEIERVAKLIEQGKIIECVQPFMKDDSHGVHHLTHAFETLEFLTDYQYVDTAEAPGEPKPDMRANYVFGDPLAGDQKNGHANGM